MTIRGYSPLALLAALFALLALALCAAGWAGSSWEPFATAGVLAVCSLTMAVLSVMDG